MNDLSLQVITDVFFFFNQQIVWKKNDSVCSGLSRGR